MRKNAAHPWKQSTEWDGLLHLNVMQNRKICTSLLLFLTIIYKDFHLLLF